jgi:hypothetical protein
MCLERSNRAGDTRRLHGLEFDVRHLIFRAGAAKHDGEYNWRVTIINILHSIAYCHLFFTLFTDLLLLIRGSGRCCRWSMRFPQFGLGTHHETFALCVFKSIDKLMNV